ncbi:MAG: hypothetical protein JEY96_02205 [Bacteroidales bacterium]|nr:hypothetical protein [Bacteroidales bacterium]
MKNYDVVINHKGAVSLSVVDSILHQLKSYINHKVHDKITRKRIYTLSVECLENIFRHADVNDEKNSLIKDYPPRFIIEKISESFIIHTGNILLNAHISNLSDRIEKLNSLELEGINLLYKESLSNAEISEKGGAGLGLIVMAKTTGQKIRYDFEKINDKFSYFAMQLNLKR